LNFSAQKMGALQESNKIIHTQQKVQQRANAQKAKLLSNKLRYFFFTDTLILQTEPNALQLTQKFFIQSWPCCSTVH